MIVRLHFKQFHFHGRAFGDLRLLQEWRFLHGQLLGVRSSPWIILGGGGQSWRTDVGQVRQMKSRVIIFSFIVGLRGLCGTPFSLGLAVVGLCPVQSKIFLRAGGRVDIRGVRLCGKWFPCVLCGAFGGSGMIGASRISRDRKRNFFICFFLLSSLGLQGGWPLK